MFVRESENVRETRRRASALADAGWAAETRPEHLLFALYEVPDCLAARILAEFGVSESAVRAELRQQKGVGAGPSTKAGAGPSLSESSARCMARAHGEAQMRGAFRVGTDHLLYALAAEGPTGAALGTLGAPADRVLTQLDRLANGGSDVGTRPRTEGHPAEVPFGVTLALAVMLMQILLRVLVPPESLHWLAGREPPAPDLPSAATLVWSLLVPAALVAPVAGRCRWAWALTEAWLTAKAVSILALTLFFSIGMLRTPDPKRLAVLLLLCAGALIPSLAAAARFFACCTWFGIRNHRARSTLLGRGGWIVAATLALDPFPFLLHEITTPTFGR